MCMYVCMYVYMCVFTIVHELKKPKTFVDIVTAKTLNEDFERPFGVIIRDIRVRDKHSQPVCMCMYVCFCKYVCNVCM